MKRIEKKKGKKKRRNDGKKWKDKGNRRKH